MKYKLLLAICLSPLFVFSQTDSTSSEGFQTIGGNKNSKSKVSGFGAFSSRFSGVADNFAYSSGFSGALLINNTFYIGGYGYWLANVPQYDVTVYSNGLGQNLTLDKRIVFGHGGILLGGIAQANKALHFGGSLQIGWGATGLVNSNFEDWGDSFNEQNWDLYGDYVFILTPEIQVEMNVTHWFKINAGLGYRWVTDVDKEITVLENGNLVEQPIFESDAFNSFTGTIGFVFGGFGPNPKKNKNK